MVGLISVGWSWKWPQLGEEKVRWSPGILPQLTVRTERKKWQLAFPPPLLSDAAHKVTLSPLLSVQGRGRDERWLWRGSVVAGVKFCRGNEMVKRRYLGIKKERKWFAVCDMNWREWYKVPRFRSRDCV